MGSRRIPAFPDRWWRWWRWGRWWSRGLLWSRGRRSHHCRLEELVSLTPKELSTGLLGTVYWVYTSTQLYNTQSETGYSLFFLVLVRSYKRKKERPPKYILGPWLTQKNSSTPVEPLRCGTESKGKKEQS